MKTHRKTEGIALWHNLEPCRFVWLWAKYVGGINHRHHCTNVLRGWYSQRLTGHDEHIRTKARLMLDEYLHESFAAIYICGVAKEGYRRHENYPHNLHAVILPAQGKRDAFRFENWSLEVENGIFDPIPGLEELPAQYRHLPDEFTTCRIFRWAVCRGAQLFAPPRK